MSAVNTPFRGFPSHASAVEHRVRATLVGDDSLSPLWWIAVGALLLCGLMFNEFATAEGPPSFFHRKLAGGFSIANVTILLFAYVAALRRLRLGAANVSRACVYSVVAVSIPVVLSVWVGVAHGSTNPFGSWKDLLMGALFAFGLWSTIAQRESDVRRFAELFVIVTTGYSVYLLGRYLLGGGVVTQTLGRTPVFDAPTLDFLVGTVALSLAMLTTDSRRRLWLSGIVLPTIVIVLSLRRHSWGELAVVVCILGAVRGVRLWDRRQGRVAPVLVVIAIAGLAVALGTGGSRFTQRLASFNVAHASTARYDNTNQSHLDDIRDGWDQVRHHWILGLGVGVRFVGARTFSWKGQGGDIHNGILTVWVIFGLLGVVEYLGGHVLLFRLLRRRVRSEQGEAAAVARGAFAFLLAQFLVSLTFVTWPFAFWQESILTFAFIALAFPADRNRAPEIVSLRAGASR
jgi:O-antigen ligase